MLETRVVDPEMVRELTRAFSPVPAAIGAVLMGSRSRGYVHRNSNADVVLLLDKLTEDAAVAIQRARDSAQQVLGYPISVNCHTLGDADPSLADDHLFMHKNRASLYILQASRTAIPLFGRNIFSEFPEPEPRETRAEAIRVVASFLYLMRKFVFDEKLAPHGKAEFVRGPLICMEYVAIFYGFLALGWRDALDFLTERALLPHETLTLLEQLGERKRASAYADLTVTDVVQGISAMEGIHQQLVDDYRTSGRTDIRWVDGHAGLHWDLAAPRVGMVLSDTGRIFLRPHGEVQASQERMSLVLGFAESADLSVNAAKFAVEHGAAGRVVIPRAEPILVGGGAYLICDTEDGASSPSRFECIDPREIAGRTDIDAESKEIIEALVPMLRAMQKE
ncbi:hypothetical protein [Myceligenerans halotolerans]